MSATLFLETLGRVSAQAALLVVVVLVVQQLLGRWLRPRWRCALWLLVAARLLLPFSADSAFSLFNWLPSWHVAASRIATAPVQQLETPAPSLLSTESRPPAIPPSPGLPVTVLVPVVAGEALPTSGTPAAQLEPLTTTTIDPGSRPSATPVAEPAFHPSLPQILFALWLAGALGLAIHIGIHSVRLARSVARLPRYEDAAALAILRECPAQLGVRRAPDLFESPAVASPVLYGLLRPRLILPAGFTQRFSTDELRCVFLHELAHLKRRDIQLNWLFAGLQVLHWFNPFIWLAVFRWRLDRELACDALVLETIGAERRQEYGRTILRLLESVTRPMAAPGLIGILEDKRQLRQRITMISRFRGRSGWGILSFLLVATLGLVCLTDAQVKKEGLINDAKPRGNQGVVPPATLVGADQVVDEGRLGGASVKTVTLTVVEAATGSPVPNAEITDTRPWLASAGQQPPRRLTDAAGQFVLHLPDPNPEDAPKWDSFKLTVQHPRFAARRASWPADWGHPTIRLPAKITIKLEPGMPIGGLVTDTSGKPLRGVKVLLEGGTDNSYRPRYPAPPHEDEPVVAATDLDEPAAITDTAGRWTFPRYPGGLESLKLTFIRPDQSRAVFATLSENLRSQQFPTAKMLGWGAYPMVSLSDLQTARARFALPAGFTVRGLVTDEAGRPIWNAQVVEGFGMSASSAELTTDRRGRFECPNRAPREWVYTASAPGHATVSQIVRIGPGSTGVKLVLPPARPVRLRIVDDQGLPVADAGVCVGSFRDNEGQRLDWRGMADTNGVIVWTNAPVKTVGLLAGSAKLGVERRVNVAAGDSTQVILSKMFAKETKVHLRAIDAASGEPVTISHVRLRNYRDGTVGFRWLSEPKASACTVKVDRSGSWPGSYATFELQAEADGYEPALPPAIEFVEGEKEILLSMARGAKVAGQVFQPDGKPAADARFWITFPQQSMPLNIGMENPHYGSRIRDLIAAADGRFELPMMAGNPDVIIMHPGGFREVTLAELKRDGSVKLVSWSRVEGRLAVDPNNPRPANRVGMHALFWGLPGNYYVNRSVTPDAEGRFVFTNVPPGDFVINLTHETGELGQWWMAGHALPIAVKPGENLVVVPETNGRRLTGRAQADAAGAVVDWTIVENSLVAKQPEIAEPNYEDFATAATWRPVLEQSQRNPERLRLARAARAYVLWFNKDGAFTSEPVPPGEYELRLRVTKGRQSNPDGSPRPEEFLGALIQTVVVPPGTNVFDLGTFKVPSKSPVVAKH